MKVRNAVLRKVQIQLLSLSEAKKLCGPSVSSPVISQEILVPHTACHTFLAYRSFEKVFVLGFVYGDGFNDHEKLLDTTK